MERQLKIIAYLLARSISLQTGEAINEIISDAVASTEDEAPEVTDDSIEKVYKQYPTKCPIRGTATGKCAKNKAQIRKLLKDHTADELVCIIDRYVRECVDAQIFIKNFGTFLNQLPDYGEDVRSGFFASVSGSRPQPQ